MALLILLLFVSLSFAQTPPGELETRKRAIALFEHENGMGLRSKALGNLMAQGRYADFHRIEVAGIWANKSDDGPKDLQAIAQWFNEPRIKPSYSDVERFKTLYTLPANASNMTLLALGMGGVVRSAKDAIGSVDLANAQAATMLGYMSDREREVLAPLKEKHIDELVAHSWGSQLAYNAIFLGVIRPPRRLIIVGAPDRNLHRWRALSEATGTQVVILGADLDAVNRVGPYLTKYLTSLNPTDPTVLSSMWERRCRNPELPPCNPAKRVGSMDADFSVTSFHLRSEYYAHLAATGRISQTAAALEERQESRLRDEEEKLLQPYLARQRAAEMVVPNLPVDDPKVVKMPPIESQDKFKLVDPGNVPLARLADGAMRPLTPSDAANQLLRLAENACVMPGRVGPQEISWAGWFPDRSIGGIEEARNQAYGCARALFDRLADLNATADPRTQTLSLAWLNKESVRLAALHKPSIDPGSEEKGSGRKCVERGIWYKYCY